MQVICISRGTLTGGKVLAERLAGALGYPCLSREDLIEAAVKEGIHVGKIEMAMVKGRGFSDRLVLEREHYLAFTRAYLCEQALKGQLVYHGRTGHLLLPGVDNVLRVRVVADQEYRLKAAMQALGLEREKARRYVEEVDEDRRQWVHTMYGVSCDDVSQYDLIVSLQQFSVENAAAGLTAIAQLPDFQMTPASRQAVEDLRLGAKARVFLARDDRTYRASFKVSASDGVITVTYLPQDAGLAESIPPVLESLEGYRSIRTTMATSNILWIQEVYDPTSEAFRNVVEVATKWGAAVELMRLAPGSAEGAAAPGEVLEAFDGTIPQIQPSSREYNGGIEDDVAEGGQRTWAENGGLKQTVEELARQGRSAGGREVRGSQTHLLEMIDRSVPYTMVVVGDVFLSKGSAAQLRLAREFRSYLADNIKTPVVATDELKAQFLFGKRDLFRLIGYLAVVLVIYFLVFTHQRQILSFLSGEGWVMKVVAAVVVFLFVPIVAYSYGTVSRSFLKLIKIE
ncbi:MAG: cytidylate kinase-like family protein [Candidatus Latescibacterota bacterium]|nr:MAG: cytidylate kinase-like family protein [Candidatus Latescibacterota bacterium]